MMSKRFPLLDLLLLESRVTESVVERSVGVRVVVSTSEVSAMLFENRASLITARDRTLIIM